MAITKDGIFFKDEHGRVRILRGVNLSGASKVPVKPDGASHLTEGFFNHREVSFIGRPFPLNQADEHFRRLKAWGLDFLRFLVTWEAVEHANPGEYDIAYLDYLEAVIDKARDYDMTIFIDFHQDVWSRFSGGDGAPGWTLEKAGFDLHNFHASGAALVHQHLGDPFPRMTWASNYSKLASATMFTLFFAGNDFAPETTIDGISAQDYLQGHYINMMKTVAGRLRDKAHVIGYDLMNEPSRGFIGLKDIRKLDWVFKIGDMPTPYEAMLLGAGFKQEVQRYSLSWTGQQKLGRRLVDPRGTRAWQEGIKPIWKVNGVWDVDRHGHPVILQPDYFHAVEGEKKTFTEHYMKTFIEKASTALHEVDPSAMIFIEFDALDDKDIPAWDTQTVEEHQIVYAPHWYPFIPLMSKRYISWIGVDAVKYRPVAGRDAKRRVYTENLKFHRDMAQKSFRGVPTVIGEIGIPYDLNDREGYIHNKWDAHIKAIDDYMIALEQNMLNYTLWNYTPDNTNARGDLWNGEDLSLFSYDQQDNADDINSGGRALIAVVRPYAKAIPGIPLKMVFNIKTGQFTFIFKHDENISEPAEIFVPCLQYPQGFDVTVSDGDYDYDAEKQTLYYRHGTVQLAHEILIMPKGQRDIFAEEKRHPILIVLSVLGGTLYALLFFFWRRREDDDDVDIAE